MPQSKKLLGLSLKREATYSAEGRYSTRMVFIDRVVMMVINDGVCVRRVALVWICCRQLKLAYGNEVV